MSKRNTIILLFSLFSLIFIIVGCESATPSQPPQLSPNTNTNDSLPAVVNIGIQEIANGKKLTQAKGFFQELGIEVNIVEFDSGRSANTALASGSIDFAMMGTIPATIAISTGLPVEVIWIYGIMGDAEALVVRNNSGIDTFEDLVGKKIAVPFASNTDYSLQNTLRINNIDAQDITILDMPPMDIYAAWQRGDIDGAFIWVPILSELMKDGKVLITNRELAEQDIITADIELVRTEFSQKYPELVANYIKALIKAHDVYINDFEDAVKTIAKAMNISEDESRKQISPNEMMWLSAEEQLESRYLGASHTKGNFVNILKDTADFLLGQKAIDNSPDISIFEAAVNPSFIEMALQ